MKTLSELARAFGVSKTTIRNRLIAFGYDFDDFPKQGNKRLIPDDALQKLENNQKVKSESKSESEVLFLRNQINELMERNRELSQALGREQALCAQRAQESDMYRKQLNSNVSEKKENFFRRLFVKKG